MKRKKKFVSRIFIHSKFDIRFLVTSRSTAVLKINKVSLFSQNTWTFHVTHNYIHMESNNVAHKYYIVESDRLSFNVKCTLFDN